MGMTVFGRTVDYKGEISWRTNLENFERILDTISGMIAQTKRQRETSSKPTRGPGRPTIDDGALVENRNALLHLLGGYWAEFAWEFKRARNVAELYAALQPLQDKEGCRPIISLFSQTSVATAKPMGIRQTLRDHNKASTTAQKALEEYNNQKESCRETGNIIREAKKVKPAFEIGAYQLEIVKEEDAKRRRRLNELEAILESANAMQDSLYQKLRVQESSFAQAELLDFVKSKRYGFTPENLAKAMAGLPQIGWRQSFLRCSALLKDSRIFHMVMPGVHPNYEMFRALDHILRSARPKRIEEALELFRNSVTRLPKRLRLGRQMLEENWPCLLDAIRTCWQEPPESTRKLPYALASAFRKSFYRPKGPLDRILSEQRHFSSPKGSEG